MASTTFKSLTDTVFDSLEGYRKAAEKADNPHLKQALMSRLERRSQTLEAMNAELQRQGDTLVTEGTVSGELHRMWLTITDMFERGDEAAAERVEGGETYLKSKFDAALEGDSLSAEERVVTRRCYDEVCEGVRFGTAIEAQFD
ncbi:PA2169 family four-helix-bundle protein [Erythrobacter sp. SDW2]|uniref:ferritin-like domain-containing protein n=1 Tax=Erythrobacter sp. SDW2 TaxID=2907154 RepID=UPI001F2A80DD|nr:PA2169 family four-helix-bundle protein [Erythrobacter sp. SDW2]UIP06084.1 PA2169 family four-helix-bundle protein [Erythrobacter sp. SDW2]